VSLFLIQEGTNPEMPAMLGRAGLAAVQYPDPDAIQCTVAYDPNLWVEPARTRVELSPTVFARGNGKDAPKCVSPEVILCDRLGRTLTALSYHLPPHVQTGKTVRWSVKRRVTVTREAMGTLRDRAKAAQTRAVLDGGDDNFDESRGFWKVLLSKYTGLRLVQAPSATHAGGRKIDDFRVKGLVPGRGWVVPVPAPDDHKVHVREWSWK
jgi:hypothetical protein